MFPPNTTIKDVISIKEICYCLVRWEKLKVKNPVIQCFKCLGFGHVAYNCYKKSTCLKCGGPHYFKDCINPNTVKCANCSGNHTANSKNCTVYNKVSQVVINKKSRGKGPEVINRNLINFQKTIVSPDILKKSIVGNSNNRESTSSNKIILITSIITTRTYAQVASRQSINSINSNNNNCDSNNSNNSNDLTFLFDLCKTIGLNKIFTCLRNMVVKLKTSRQTDIFHIITTIIECVTDTFVVD